VAVTLAQAAVLSENDLQRGVVETFIVSSPVLDRVPLLDIEGNAYAYNKEATLPGVEFRAVNAAYVESTGTVTQTTVSLVILGGDADVDRFIVQTRGNVNDQRAIQEAMKSKAIALKWQDTFINGDTAVDANSFDGLKKLLTGAQLITAGTNGIPVVGNGGTDVQTFFDQLDATLAAVPGGVDALYMNAQILAKIRAAGRRLMTISQSERDEFGRTVDFYNGIPMYDIGNKADGTAIIPQTETQGTSNVASSIYAVKWSANQAENGVAALNNGGIDVRDLGEQDAKSVLRTRIEWFTGLAIFGRGAARLAGVLNA
jgi:hypothetical protein